MTSIEQIARQYRGIRCNHIAQSLADLLRQAEANEVSYLAFAESLVTEELQRRNRRRIDMNRRKAGFPVDKRLAEFDYRHQTTITKRQVNHNVINLSLTVFFDTASGTRVLGLFSCLSGTCVLDARPLPHRPYAAITARKAPVAKFPGKA